MDALMVIIAPRLLVTLSRLAKKKTLPLLADLLHIAKPTSRILAKQCAKVSTALAAMK